MKCINEPSLFAVLQRCRDLTAASKNSDWSCLEVPAIVAVLDGSILGLQSSVPIDVNELRFLFAVAGPLQETAMSNRWANEYLVLAESFARAIGENS